MLTLGEAAKASGISKTSIRRALDSGRISGAKNDAGQWQIDPAELFRAYPPAGTHAAPPPPDLERENAMLRDQLAREREISRDLAADRDAWRTQAQTLLPPPKAAPAPSPIASPWRSFLGRLRAR